MGFARAVLLAHPHRAFSIVEDVEYGIQLGYAGVAVHYVHEAQVFGQMVVGEQASRSQRERWENGRRDADSPARVAAAPQRPGSDGTAFCWTWRSILLVPPLGEIVAAIAVGGIVSAVVVPLGHGVAPWVWGTAAAGVLLYVARAWVLSGVGMAALLDLLFAPFYVLWKLTLRMRPGKRRSKDEWVRTTREVRM